MFEKIVSDLSFLAADRQEKSIALWHYVLQHLWRQNFAVPYDIVILRPKLLQTPWKGEMTKIQVWSFLIFIVKLFFFHEHPHCWWSSGSPWQLFYVESIWVTLSLAEWPQWRQSDYSTSSCHLPSSYLHSLCNSLTCSQPAKTNTTGGCTPAVSTLLFYSSLPFFAPAFRAFSSFPYFFLCPPWLPPPPAPFSFLLSCFLTPYCLTPSDSSNYTKRVWEAVITREPLAWSCREGEASFCWFLPKEGSF